MNASKYTGRKTEPIANTTEGEMDLFFADATT